MSGRERRRTETRWQVRCAIVVAFTIAWRAPGQQFGPLRFLLGDGETAPAVETQSEIGIAPGGPGFLAVWTDERPVLSGTVNAPENSLSGNMQDVYGQILDHSGEPIGPPIVVSNAGRNQRDPMAAWNGQNWLVVFESQDPYWYFDDEVHAVRVSPQGEVLDEEPIQLFEEYDLQGAYDPDVTSDGQNWLAICDQWVDGSRTVRARRVAPDGRVIDAQPINMLQSRSLQDPVVAFTDGAYILAADSYSLFNTYFQTFDSNLNATSALTEIGPSSTRTMVAGNGSHFMVVGARAFRIGSDGTLFDPGGIHLGGSLGVAHFAVSWTGTHWTVSMRRVDDFSDDVYGQRISDSGVVLDPEPVLIESAPQSLDAFEAPTAIGGAGNGDAVALFVRRDIPRHFADVRAAMFSSGGIATSAHDVSVGLSRQSYVRFAENADGALAVYVSERSGQTQLLAQRLAASGDPIDSEPTVIAATNEEGVLARFIPSVAWNGSVYFVAWQDAPGRVVGVRISADNSVLDPQPIVLTPSSTDSFGLGAVAAADEVFVVGVFRRIAFHEPVRYAEFVRVSENGVVLDANPIFVAGGFSREMTGQGFGGAGFLAWAQYSRHDSTTSYIEGVLVNANGSHSARLRIGAMGMEPDIADGGDRALVVWQDDTTIHQDDIKGRLVAFDGTFLGSEFVVNSGAHEQMRPAAAFDGVDFVVAWEDFRHQTGQVDQLRGDIYSTRVAVEGTVLNPMGEALTTGPLPESLPDVAGVKGAAIAAFSILHGDEGTPEIQRIGYRVAGEGFGLTLDQSALRRGDPATFTVTGAVENERVVVLYSLAGVGAGPCPPELGGLCLDLLSPIDLIGIGTADANGTARVTRTVPKSAPLGKVSTQAVARRGSGGRDSVKSNTVTDRIQP